MSPCKYYSAFKSDAVQKWPCVQKWRRAKVSPRAKESPCKNVPLCKSDPPCKSVPLWKSDPGCKSDAVQKCPLVLKWCSCKRVAVQKCPLVQKWPSMQKWRSCKSVLSCKSDTHPYKRPFLELSYIISRIRLHITYLSSICGRFWPVRMYCQNVRLIEFLEEKVCENIILLFLVAQRWNFFLNIFWVLAFRQHFKLADRI